MALSLRIASLLTLLLPFALVACTHRMQVHATPVVYPAQPPLDQHIGLRITPEYSSYIFSKYFMGDTVQSELGPLLASETQRMAEALFVQVQPITAGTVWAEGLVLEPRVVGADHTIGTTWPNPFQTMTIDVEWRLINPSGKVVWLQTVRGEGTVRMGNAINNRRNWSKRSDAALAALFLESYHQIRNAPVW